MMSKLLDKIITKLQSAVDRRVRRYRADVIYSIPNVTVGRHTYGVRQDLCFKPSVEASVTIGNFCSIGPGVVLMARGDHRTDLPSTYPFRTKLWAGEDTPNRDAVTKGPIHIGHDVWIGMNAIILSGVTVGSGAVIGAGAVVARDVPPYAIVTGNPAMVKRYRFSPEIINALMETAWWELSDAEICKIETELYSPDIGRFLSAVDAIKVTLSTTQAES